MNKERIEELIELFCDADRRGRLTEEEGAYCPTLAETIEVRA